MRTQDEGGGRWGRAGGGQGVRVERRGRAQAAQQGVRAGERGPGGEECAASPSVVCPLLNRGSRERVSPDWAFVYL